MENPYAAPRSEITEHSGSVALYSPKQVAAGAFLGGPVGLIYFLRANFVALGNQRMAKMSLIGGALLMLALLMILPLLPTGFPSSPITIAYMIAGQQIAIRYQLTKDAIGSSTVYRFAPNWGVVGVGLLCLIGSLVLVIGPLLLIGMLKQ